MRIFLRVLLVISVLVIAIMGYAVYKIKEGIEPEAPPDFDKVQRLPAVVQGREAAIRDIDAVLAGLEGGLGAGFERRTQSVLDECGSKKRPGGFFGSESYEPVICRREVVRYYVVAGPRSDRVDEIVTALYDTGMYGDYPGWKTAAGQGCSPDPTPSAEPTPTTNSPAATPFPAAVSSDGPTPAPSSPPVSRQPEAPCEFSATAQEPAPSRGIRAEVRSHNPRTSQTPVRQTWPLDVVGSERRDEPADFGLVDAAVMPSDVCILGVSVLINYYTEAD